VTAAVTERGHGWVNIVAECTNVPTTKLYLALVREAIDSKEIQLYASTAEQRQLFAETTFWRSAEPYLVADDDGYQGGNALLGMVYFDVILCHFLDLMAFGLDARSELGGIRLQWSQLYQPYTLNFVQYRPIVNLTLTGPNNDNIAAFKTLSMVFESAFSKEFLIPRVYLGDGAWYEFRLGFVFSDYTAYTNTRTAKTFDASSPFVNSVVFQSTNQSISVSWEAPEYADGIVGYKTQISYLQRGIVPGPWNTSLSTVLDATQVSLTHRTVMLGCSSFGTSGCLYPSTTYLIEIAVIRNSGIEKYVPFYYSTVATPMKATNMSQLFFRGGSIKMSFVSAVPRYNNTPVSLSFLHPLRIGNANNNVNIDLTSSTVLSSSDASLVVWFSIGEFLDLSRQIYLANVFSAMTLYYGSPPNQLHLGHYCLWVHYVC
jgi:hypothetical protein